MNKKSEMANLEENVDKLAGETPRGKYPNSLRVSHPAACPASQPATLAAHYSVMSTAETLGIVGPFREVCHQAL